MFLPAGLKRFISIAIGTVYPFMCSVTAAATDEIEDDTGETNIFDETTKQKGEVDTSGNSLLIEEIRRPLWSRHAR